MTYAGLLALALLAGCGTDTADDDTQAAGTDEPTAFPHDDYTFVFSRTCFCIDRGVRIRVTVEDGEFVSGRYVGGGASGPVTRDWQRITMDDVIALTRTEDAAHVEVVWPDGQDYPDSVWVDYDRRMADEEMGYQVHRVVVTD